MKSNRRHESLIPLSREHHYGLLVCLRIHRGIENHQADVSWLSERADKVIRFFECDLKTHFEAEEEIVFPAMSGIEDSKATIDQLVKEHRNLERLVQRLRKARELQLAPHRDLASTEPEAPRPSFLDETDAQEILTVCRSKISGTTIAVENADGFAAHVQGRAAFLWRIKKWVQIGRLSESSAGAPTSIFQSRTGRC